MSLCWPVGFPAFMNTPPAVPNLTIRTHVHPRPGSRDEDEVGSLEDFGLDLARILEHCAPDPKSVVEAVGGLGGVLSTPVRTRARNTRAANSGVGTPGRFGSSDGDRRPCVPSRPACNNTPKAFQKLDPDLDSRQVWIRSLVQPSSCGSDQMDPIYIYLPYHHERWGCWWSGCPVTPVTRSPRSARACPQRKSLGRPSHNLIGLLGSILRFQLTVTGRTNPKNFSITMWN